MKRIKAEISPALLTAGEWSTWSGKARDILKTNPEFGVSQDNSDVFTVKDRPVSVTEKLYNEFMAQKNFYDKISAIRDYANNKKASPDSELFTEMFSFFTAFLRQGQDTEHSVPSYLLISELAANKNYAHLKPALTVSFEGLFSGIKDVPALFKNIKDAKLKTEFLSNVKQYVNNWPDIYIKLFPFSLLPSIPEQLEEAGFAEKLTNMCANCFEYHKDYREAVVWLYKSAAKTEWFKAAGIDREKQLITLINILDITFRDIDNHKDTVENRKINKQVYNILFKDGELEAFIGNSDEDAIIRIFTFINAVKDLDPQDKLNLRTKILDKYPDFKFLEEAEKKVSKVLWVTRAMFEEKQKKLSQIMNEEIPANARDIEYAREKGDLRENAEYKAAKEKQEHLTSELAKLKDELERAQQFDFSQINTDKVSFGTKVTLRNENTGQQEEYTLLGPWESDPNNNIISYLSPFGSAILNKTSGERFEFVINDGKVFYLVENISAAVL
jgi:transcription elongation factor GreA